MDVPALYFQAVIEHIYGCILQINEKAGFCYSNVYFKRRHITFL